MISGMKRIAAVLVLCMMATAAAAQCGFKSEPVAERHWYRSEGWKLPGIDSGSKPIPVNFNMKARFWSEGMTASVIQLSEPYVVFPGGVFEEDGKAMKTEARTLAVARGWVKRWEINGKVYAYSYTLHDVRGSWIKGKFVLREGGLLCMFSVAFVDDKGDGVFRLMTNAHPDFAHPPALPEWALKPKG